MIEILFEGHAQTHHNAIGVASGHYDVALTDKGREQASSAGRQHYANAHFDAVFTSDTQRAFHTAGLIFAGRDIPIMQDARLRECDYGDFEGRPRSEMEAARPSAIRQPFPNGESYEQVALRMRDFLRRLAATYDGKRVLLVGHMATLWMLEHWLRHIPLAEAVGNEADRSRLYLLNPTDWLTSRDIG
jgi:broad specificity phosphatase PhoE